MAFCTSCVFSSCTCAIDCSSSLRCDCNKFFCTEKNKKRDIRDWYQSGSDRYGDMINDKSREILRRGDIPVLSGDCDGKHAWSHHFVWSNKQHFSSILIPFLCCTDALTKAIQDLIALVKQLREDVARQTNEINHLRHLIENCAGCRETAPVSRETCQNANPCFDGVQCYDSDNGPRCGRCPSGKSNEK